MSELPAAGFERWAHFPVSARPRPVVLLDHRVRVTRGFASMAPKSAWMRAQIRVDVDLPDAVVDLITDGRGPQPTADPLVIIDVERSSYGFRCDRGTRLLPAYVLRVTLMGGPCVVLDPDVDVWWPRPGEPDKLGYGGTVYLGDDGRTVRFPAFGGRLTDFHRGEFDEHDAYVVGRAITSERLPTPDGGVDVGRAAWVTGHLHEPLGDRVMLSGEYGRPFEVRPESDASPHDRRSWSAAL